MKFFKPKLVFESNSSTMARWEKVLEEYAEYISELLPKVSDEMQEYIGLTNLHDCVVTSAKYDNNTNQLCLILDESLTVLFFKVQQHSFEANSISALVSDVWLYDEVELLEDAKFEFRILFEGGELKIRAAGAAVRKAL